MQQRVVVITRLIFKFIQADFLLFFLFISQNTRDLDFEPIMPCAIFRPDRTPIIVYVKPVFNAEKFIKN